MDNEMGTPCWPDCPVSALGVRGEHMLFRDVLGRRVEVEILTAGRLLKLFGGDLQCLSARFPITGHSGEVVSCRYDYTAAQAALVKSCFGVGIAPTVPLVAQKVPS